MIAGFVTSFGSSSSQGETPIFAFWYEVNYLDRPLPQFLWLHLEAIMSPQREWFVKAKILNSGSNTFTDKRSRTVDQLHIA